MDNKKRIILLIVISVLIILTLSLGLTYAFMKPQVEETEEKSNINISACAKIQLKDNGKFINLENTYPMDDEKGLETKPYEFTITSTCEDYVGFNLYLTSLTTNTIDDNAIHFAITDMKNNVLVTNVLNKTTNGLSDFNSNELSELDKGIKGTHKNIYKVYNNNIPLKGESEYKLYLWVDKNIKEETTMNKSISVGVSVKSYAREETMVEYLIKNKDDTLIYHDGIADYPKEENVELETGDLSYRFSGASNIVNNYVCLDGKNTTGNCTSDENLYRIIGLFLNNVGQYEIKLIKFGFATDAQAGGSNVGAGLGPAVDTTNQVYRWNQFRNNSGTNYNNWQDSNLNIVNLNTYFYNYMVENIPNFLNIVEKHSWIIGGLDSKTFNVKNAKDIYNDEVGINKIKIGDNSCYLNDNTTNLRNCGKEDVEYLNYFGLMYLSDYMYGALPANWNLITYDDETQNDYRLALNNDWLAFSQSNEWVITRDSSSYNTVLYTSFGRILSTTLMYSYSTIRPSFYIKSSIKLVDGNGTKDNPYRITI